jgi:autotransporter-associated beta strand protein
MKPRVTTFQNPHLALLCFICGAYPGVLLADSGTWSGSTTGGSYVWNTSGSNWTTTDPDGYPSGTDSIATFNSDFSGTITMTGDNTLGGISFTDTVSTGIDFRLSSGKLTFDTTVGTPTINYVNGTGNGILWLGQAATFAISGNDGLKIDAGNSGQTVRLGNATGNVGINWSGFSGGLVLAQGSFQPQVGNVLPSAAGSWVTLGAGTTSATLNLFQDTRNQSITGLNGTSNGRLFQGSYSQNKAGTLTLLTNSVSTDAFDFAGVLGSVSTTPLTVRQESHFGITLNGAGTQTLSGANTYVSQTTVTAGTLKLGSDTALGGGVTATLTTTAANNTATVDDSTGLTVGQLVSGAGVAPGTYITAVNGTTITLSSNAAASGTNSTTFAGVTTVASGGVVDLNGRTITESFGTNGSDGLAGTGLGAGGTLKNTSGTTAVINGNILSNSSYTIGSGNITVNGIVGRRSSGGSTITKIGTGTLTLGGTANNATFGAVGLIIDSANSTVVLAKNGANILAVSDVTINSGTLKMDPSNQVTAANAWSGQIANTVTMNGGTWDLNDSGTNGVNNRVKGVIGSAGNITNSGTSAAQLTFGLRDNGTKEFSGTISDGVNGGTVSLVVADTNAGTPYQKLSGNNSFSGGTTINSGRMIMGHNNAFGSGAVANKGQLDLNGFTLGNALTSPGNGAVFTNAGATAATVSTGFNAAGTAGVVISDFTVNGTADINWSGAIRRTNFTGTVTKSGTNTLTLSGAGTGYAGMAYTVSGGTLAFNMTNGSDFNSGTITSTTSVVGAQGSGVTNTISSAINGTGGTFTQSGAGTTILAATNGYTGATSVNAGTLVVNGSIANSATTVQTNGVLTGTGTLGSSLTVKNTGVVNAGTVGTVNTTASVTGATSFESGSIFSWDLSADGTTADKLNTGSVTGPLAGDAIFRVVLADGTVNDSFFATSQTNFFAATSIISSVSDLTALFNTVQVYSGITNTAVDISAQGYFTLTSSGVSWSAVPEPTSALAGLLVTAGLLRRRRC